MAGAIGAPWFTLAAGRPAVCALPDIATPASAVCGTEQTGGRSALHAGEMPHRALEPAFTVERKLGDIEIRDYARYAVAETFVGASADLAGNLAFPVLAGYIFGKNKGARAFAITAPVSQAAAPMHFAMQAPVTQTAKDGGYLVQFVLPRDVTPDTAPEPDDPRVRIRDVPAHQVAVIRYSGLWSRENYAQHLATLTAALEAAGLHWDGEPVFSRYNAPWTPWFLRRNEIWVSLR
jgi:hypothetical protein